MKRYITQTVAALAFTALLLAALLLAACDPFAQPAPPPPEPLATVNPTGTSHFMNIEAFGDLTVGDDFTLTDDAAIGDDITVTGDLKVGNGTPSTTLNGEDAYVEGTFEVDGAINLDGAVDMASTLTIAGAITSAQDLENMVLPTVGSEAITYQSSGALWTSGATEVWFIHALYCNITTNFDCTGDDCTVHIGDGNDEDGFLDLDDGELQTADTEGTGAAAGWQGFMGTATRGVYLAEGLGFVYANDTIDIVVAGTDPAAGAGVCYIVYTRIQ